MLLLISYSPSSNVATGCGADAGPRPTVFLAATVILKLENIGRPRIEDKWVVSNIFLHFREHCIFENMDTFNLYAEGISL